MSWLYVIGGTIVVLVVPLIPAIPGALWFKALDYIDWWWDLKPWQDTLLEGVGWVLLIGPYVLVAWYVGFTLDPSWIAGCPPYTC